MELNRLVTQIRDNNNWNNQSRIVGEACEEYIKNNINFEKCKTNEKSKDLVCLICHQKYQIKAKCASQKQINNISKNQFKTIGDEYSTTIHNIDEKIDYLIILYEKNSYKIKKNIMYQK